MKLMKNTKGFTLVEIMIVVAIICLLAAIAVPNFVTARTNAKKNACINNLRMISSAKDQYALDTAGVAEATVPTAVQLGTYVKGTFPVCPNGGAYGIAAISAVPTCPNAVTLLHTLP